MLMSNREPTRWQHNRIYPQPISLCKSMIVKYDSVNITCIIITHTLYHAHCYTVAVRINRLIVVHLRNVTRKKYPNENNNDHLLAKSNGYGGG